VLLGISQGAWAQTAIQQVTTHQSRCPNTGIISVAATGSNLRYSISGTETGTGNAVTLGPQDSNTFTTVNPGTYTVTVRDYVSTEAVTRENVVVGGSYAPLQFAASVTDQTCKSGSDGSITVSVSAGAGRAAYTYSLLDQNNNVVLSQASNVFTGLTPATYRVQVADSCTNVSRQDVTVGSKGYNTTIGGQLRTEGFTSCSVVSLVFVADGAPSTWEPPFTVTQVSGGGNLTTDPTVLSSLTDGNARFSFSTTGADFFVPSPTSSTPRLRITDACGRVYEQAVYNTQVPTVDRIASRECSGTNLTVRLPYVRLFNNGQVQLTVLDNTGTVVVNPHAPDRITTGASGEYLWGVPGQQPGDYTLRFTNGCGGVDYPLTLGTIALGVPIVSCGVSCTPGRTDVLFSPGTPTGSTPPAAPYTYTLTSGPAGQNYPLSYSSNGGFYTIPALLPGSYTYTLSAQCGQSYSGSFDANCSDYTFSQGTEAQPTCGNLRLASAYSPDAGVPTAFVVRTLQLKDPSTGTFQAVSNPATDNLGQTSLGTYTLRYTNLAAGTYREQLSYGPYNNPCRVAYSAEVTLVPSVPVLDASQAFNCTDNTGQVAAAASGGYPPYTYYLLDTSNNDAVLASNTTGAFTGLMPAIRYALRVEDACNSARRDISLRTLSPPDVKISILSCDATSLTLQALELYGATYTWTGPNGFTATDRTISLTNIDNTKMGTYTVSATLNGCASTSTSYEVRDGFCQPLPVSLVRFTAQRQPSGAVALAWTTASELNSLRFEVERSLDGQHFATVGELAAAGSSATARSYAFTDGAAAAGRLYYRLRQLDRDGTAHYSAVATVAGGSAFSAYPNPWVGPALQLQLGATPTGPITCTLHNAAGQLVLRTQLPAATTVLQAPSLAPGFYHLTVECNGTLLGSQRIMRE